MKLEASNVRVAGELDRLDPAADAERQSSEAIEDLELGEQEMAQVTGGADIVITKSQDSSSSKLS